MDFHVESVKNVSSKFAISNTVPVLFMGFGAVSFFSLEFASYFFQKPILDVL